MEVRSKIFDRIIIVCIMLFVMGVASFFFLSEKHVKQYYLDSYHDNGNDYPCIKLDIDNAPDQNINLNKDITFSQAIHMVDSLNLQLQKYPITK